MPCLLQERINITLDHRCRIFQNLDGALGEQPPQGGDGGKERGIQAGSDPKGERGLVPLCGLCWEVALLIPRSSETTWGRAVCPCGWKKEGHEVSLLNSPNTHAGKQPASLVMPTAGTHPAPDPVLTSFPCPPPPS